MSDSPIAASTESAISVRGVAKHYQIYKQPSDRLRQSLMPRLQRLLKRPVQSYCSEFRALDDISFEVKKGETIGIIGRNGSGKSTLLQMICGTLAPSAGSIQVNGRIAALLELGAGFNPEFTGRENAFMNAALLGLSQEEIEARIEQIIEFSGIGDFIDRPVKTYSSGMYVRLAFSVVAHVDADILIIDEALAVGDAMFTQKCMRFLRKFRQNGTILFVSHDTNAVIGLCKRAIWIDQGGIQAEGTPKDVANQYLKAFFENQQGASVEATSGETSEDADQEKPILLEMPRDMRQDLVNASPWRNDLEIFSFDPSQDGFGKGGALIEDIVLQNTAGEALSWVVGGEEVVLQMRARVQFGHELKRPILGFYVKDRLGQNLFGDNTFLSYQDSPVSAQPDQVLVASFHFRMPILPPGDYSIGAAVADGTQHNHVQHHWIHDALFFKSHSTSQSHGLVGIPMQDIRLETGAIL